MAPEVHSGTLRVGAVAVAVYRISFAGVPNIVADFNGDGEPDVATDKESDEA
ncbi:MAG TPA: hypothetical protein VN950_06450 [Terriglobales bacterium]|nr:hypothetical protein [Terriglobales bacterium]